MANRKYKDTVFRMLYGNNKKELLERYNAVNDTAYDDPEAIRITTLKDAICIGIKNDVSFLLQDMLSLYEHQSTPNPNLPLRDLFYVSAVLKKLVKGKDIYASTNLEIPTPQFIMFYNGTTDLQEVTEYRLSDLFSLRKENPELELVVKIINVNAGEHNRVLENCRTMREYAEFVRTVREYLIEHDLEEALRLAIDDCIARGVLADFLRKNRTEVMNVSMYDFSYAKHEDNIWEEGREAGYQAGVADGRNAGLADGRADVIHTMLQKGRTTKEIADFTGIDLTEIQNVLKSEKVHAGCKP